MKKIKEILKDEGICLKELNYQFSSRVQRLCLDISEYFDIDNEWGELKEELPFDNIRKPTLKKFMNNLVVAKHLHHRSTDESLYNLLLSDSSYRFYPRNFYYSNNL